MKESPDTLMGNLVKTQHEEQRMKPMVRGTKGNQMKEFCCQKKIQKNPSEGQDPVVANECYSRPDRCLSNT